MTETATFIELEGLMKPARDLDRSGRPAEAVAEAWRALDLAPDDIRAKNFLVRLLFGNPEAVPRERRADLRELLADPAVDPTLVAPAGWHLMLAPGRVLAGLTDDLPALAGRIEAEDFPRQLLEECHVASLEVEIPLTRLRRWLLLSDRWRVFPRLVAALAAQARRNGGAWPFDPEEQARLDALAGTPIAAAYLPSRPSAGPAAAFADAVTRSVAGQYRHWPYPPWTRAMAPPPATLPAVIERADGGRPSGLPVAAEILVAGCGTGREAALAALGYPDARITAIDISATSLAYAAERCQAAGIQGVEFRLLDLHDAADLGKSFDFITCSGVLHHLPDPEEGWAALLGVLKPGGVMRISVYSALARLRVRAARTHVADLIEREVDDDLLREVRRRLIDRAPKLVERSQDFYTLGGVHDLLLHRHEDPFDVRRIARALDRFGMELLAFELPTSSERERYRRENPHDSEFRDVEAWAALEKRNPFLFASMHCFWCRKPAG